MLPIIREPVTASYIASMEKRLTAIALDCVLTASAAVAIQWIAKNLRLADPGIWIIGVTAFIAYQAYALRFFGGTSVGRSLTGICVVDARGRGGLAFWQSIGRPCARVMWLLGPGALAYHAQSEAHEALALWATLPLVTDLLLLATHARRQTVADVICRTVVLNTPPPQPHRAPAAPMYSATDCEFGVRPRKV